MSIQVPTDRPELVGLRILCLSDTHDMQQFMPGECDELPTVDILVHAGDFTVRGTSEEIGNFRDWMERILQKQIAKYVVVVAGNHELTFEPWKAKHAAVRSRQEATKASLTSIPNLFYLEDTGIEVAGLKFYGSPWVTPIGGKMDWAFQMRDHDLGAEKWCSIPDRGSVDILVTHCPPYGQGDASVEGAAAGAYSVSQKPLGHVGSRSLRGRVQQVEPLLHIFGHFHEGYGVSTCESLRTLFINAAICDEDYQPVHAPLLVEFVADRTVRVGALIDSRYHA